MNMIERVARAIAFSEIDESTLKALDPEIFKVSDRHIIIAIAAIREMKRFDYKPEDSNQISDYELTRKEAKAGYLSVLDIILSEVPNAHDR